MTHARVQRQLSALLDNELTADEAQELRAHLETCARCREELEHLQGLKRLLGAVQDRTPPAQLWDDLRRRVDAPAPGAVAGLLETIRAAFRRPALATAAAAVVLMLVAFPLVRGRIDRLRAAEIGPDLFVREHALAAATDPFADRAYLGLLVSDVNLVLIGERRERGEELR